MLVRQISVESKNHTPKRHARRDGTLYQRIPLLIDEISPNHHRNHLRALTERLYRERDVSQRLVLTRRCQDVGRAHARVLPERRRRFHHPLRA